MRGGACRTAYWVKHCEGWQNAHKARSTSKDGDGAVKLQVKAFGFAIRYGEWLRLTAPSTPVDRPADTSGTLM